jgi:ABC-type glutathione transport system ATPase component
VNASSWLLLLICVLRRLLSLMAYKVRSPMTSPSSPQASAASTSPSRSSEFTAPALQTHELTKAFGGNIVLRNVSLEVAAGEIHGLVGENGAGKSTLINLVTGVYEPDSGTVSLSGKTVTPGAEPLPASDRC